MVPPCGISVQSISLRFWPIVVKQSCRNVPKFCRSSRLYPAVGYSSDCDRRAAAFGHRTVASEPHCDGQYRTRSRACHLHATMKPNRSHSSLARTPGKQGHPYAATASQLPNYERVLFIGRPDRTFIRQPSSPKLGLCAPVHFGADRVWKSTALLDVTTAKQPSEIYLEWLKRAGVRFRL